jgi:hypothetical protein
VNGNLIAYRWFWTWRDRERWASKIHLSGRDGLVCGAEIPPYNQHHGRFTVDYGASPLEVTCGKCKRAKGMKRKLELYRAYLDAEYERK